MYKIIKATLQHAPILGEIHATSWRTAYAGLIDADYLRNYTPEKRTARFRRALQQNREENYLLYVDDQPAGFICLGPNRDEDRNATYGEIWGLYLHPAFWRQGAGSYLMQWALTELAQRGYQMASLWVLEENWPARRFYEHCGFRFDVTIQPIRIGGHELNEVRYERSLSKDTLI